MSLPSRERELKHVKHNEFFLIELSLPSRERELKLCSGNDYAV